MSRLQLAKEIADRAGELFKTQGYEFAWSYLEGNILANYWPGLGAYAIIGRRHGAPWSEIREVLEGLIDEYGA